MIFVFVLVSAGELTGQWLTGYVYRKKIEISGDNVYGAADLAHYPLLVSLIDPDREEFLNPASMTDAIADFCRQTGQPVPANEGAYIRCCLESLAMQYSRVLEMLSDVYKKSFDTIHIVGGGTQNKLLNQFTADAAGTRVIAGPLEATIIGNIIIQAIGMGHIKDLSEGRQIIRNSFDLETYAPQQTDQWDQQYERFMKLKNS